ncbi:somatostatin receptor type 1-like isoform X1 [Convolutriloba macropyga]|uniref:somatostatin receptor type 1-like isoform X1 n=1 Tax=Convolutriloba macropyga TaxID=536237 RepID=UPI003F5254B7
MVFAGVSIQHYDSWMCQFIWFSATVVPLCAKYLLCCITVERLMAINCAVFYRNHVNSKWANVCGMGVVLFSCLVSLPYWFIYSVVENADGLKTCSLIKSNYAKHFQNYSRFTLGGVIPISFILFCNIVILVQLRRRIERQNQQKRRAVSMLAAEKAEIDALELAEKSKITKMLLSVSFVFVICHSASVVISWSFTSPATTNHEWAKRYLLYSLANFTLILCSSMNIFLYFLTNDKIRKHFFRVIKVCTLKCASAN